MFKKLRIAILLYVLLFVAASQYLTRTDATDWKETLWVDAYLINADGSVATQHYLDGLDTNALERVDAFFAAEAARYGLELTRPFRIEIAGQQAHDQPPMPQDGRFFETLWWSLAMRWYTARLHWHSNRPTPDITLFVNFYDGDGGSALDRSTALRKAMIAIANVFADRAARGSNEVIIAHELLHTLGATDKYDAATNLPLFPIGYADPDRIPLYPQERAELMGGRIPSSASGAIVPPSLARTVVGDTTAFEIGWLEELAISGQPAME